MINPSLPLLEYCKLDRAARLLDCEVSDLLHWASIGEIEVCVMLNNAITTLSIKCPTNHFLEVMGIQDGEIDQGVTLGMSYIFPINKHDSNECYVLGDDADEYSRHDIHCLASGLWKINSQWNVIELISKGKTKIADMGLSISDLFIEDLFLDNYLFEDSDYILHGTVIEPIFKTFGEITANDVWISQNQINILRMYAGISMLDGEAWWMANMSSGLSSSVKEVKPVHHRTEKSAVSRLAVLEAAIYIKENNSDDFTKACIKSDGSYNITKWAELVIDSTYLFDNGRIPLTDKQTIMDVISHAFCRKQK